MSAATETAIILAAGMGRRMGEAGADQPKGFLQLGGETLVERSIRCLREAGMRRIVIVAGFRAETYAELAARQPEVEVVSNTDYASTESMASLACALDVVDSDFLLLESDLFYEPRALQAVLDHEADDVVLISDPTGATDEVWVEAPGGCLRKLSKDRSELKEVSGEYVGVLRISRPLAALMRAAYEAFVAQFGHGRMAYETDALVLAARTRPVRVCLVPDLLWGEVDYDQHYRRLREEVWPAFQKTRSGA